MGKINKGMKSELKTIWENIKEMLNVVCEDDGLSDAEKKRAWDIFSIGTDYDGYIDPIDPYPTALNFKNFRKDLHDIIQKELDENSGAACLKVLDDKLTPMIAVDKICWRNARDFVIRNYPE
jgi:hypothetical protein